MYSYTTNNTTNSTTNSTTNNTKNNTKNKSQETYIEFITNNYRQILLLLFTFVIIIIVEYLTRINSLLKQAPTPANPAPTPAKPAPTNTTNTTIFVKKLLSMLKPKNKKKVIKNKK